MALYVVAFQGRTYAPDGASDVPPSDVEAHNARATEAELAAWAERPREAFVYVNALDNLATVPLAERRGHYARANVETWTGAKLGIGFLGAKVRDNFGGTRYPITVRATNGWTYHGWFYASAGDYARIKAHRRNTYTGERQW